MILVIDMKEKLINLKDIKIAHRGLCRSGLIENSMSAFRECVENNIPIELDVHILKDNTLVVIHDDDTERVVGRKIVLKNSVYEDIKDLKLKGTSEGIPLFVDVLDMVSGKVLLDIELKYDVKDFRICVEICKLLDKYNGKFMIKSFNSFYIWWFKKYRNDYMRGLILSVDFKRTFLRLVDCFCEPEYISFNYKKLPYKNIIIWKIVTVENSMHPLHTFMNPK